MDFKRLVEIVGDEPAFETGLLLAGDVDPDDVRRQLSRWARAGRIFQLRRGVYALAPPFQKVKPHPFALANLMVRGSYVSCQSALAHYGLIPEYVPVVTSVAIARPARWETPLGQFEFRHIKPAMHFGYRQLELGQGQTAFVACPEKAVLDLIHLTAEGDSRAYLAELRLQFLDRLDPAELARLAERAGRPKLARAAARVRALRDLEIGEYRDL
jgi:hypothetical protein